jgi:asparagine synthase (glutamine-hydrolysing)
MCGISGIYKLNEASVSLETLKRFTDSMIHRGPDGAGYELFENNTLGLGQRRLSILDLSEAGKQPMSYANGRYWITYNGEVFNFIEIKAELIQLGYSFHSETDTEVILASYAHWGKACMDKFNGMWAFAIWDNQEKTLFMARDRFGIKPLYYTYVSNQFIAFASETIAFKHLDGFERTINQTRVNEITKNGLAHEGLGLTIFNNIYQILPGHTLTIYSDKKVPKQKRWYDIRTKILKSTLTTYQENVNIFYTLFEDACKIRMRSDVPLASALSGGLDSSSVYSMVHHLSQKAITNERKANNWQKAITAVFPGTPMDEMAYAEIVANKWGKDNWVCIQNNISELEQEIKEITEKFDAISATSMNSISKIYEGVRNQGIVVSLDGHGVDEMLFGYRYMLDKLFYHYIENSNINNATLIKDVLINLYEDNQRSQIDQRLSMLINQKMQSNKGIKGFIKNFFHTRIPKKTNYTFKKNELTDSPYDFSSFDFEDQILLEDFFIYSLPTYLRDFDRASMMHSVEVRMPFMDYRLVEFCFNLPIEHKLGMGYTKRIIRDAMKNIVPQEILDRTYKIGISSPLSSWFNKELKGFIIQLLKEPSFINILKELEFNDASYYLEPLLKESINNQQASELWMAYNLSVIKK